MGVMPISAKSQVPDGDIAANEALLLHAEAARLAKSWLRGALGAGSDNDQHRDDKVDEDLDLKREQDLFGPNAALQSENGGVGFQEPSVTNATTPSSRGSDQTTAFLRKQLLRGHNNSHATAKPRPRPFTSRRHDSEDEEEGRSGLGKARSKGKGQTASSSLDDGSVHPRSDTATQAADREISHPTPTPASTGLSRTSKKRGSSYLDEVLASRAAKKNKKVQKRS